ncbi:ATP-binding protein [Nocardia cyriacigeorgica]|uniref:ATP-binding protein n=1 Tax=Nocardia cyriacigeorgica TaxID=135487 RepID=A0A5R8N8T4_9NOCA|nr:ATP-binding protein [Nocardia cyriacigeorgica]TLF72046.1 ATP-binding protein [Nocardia cyriacigeorgica]
MTSSVQALDSGLDNETRLLRGAGIFVGSGGLFYGLLVLPRVSSQAFLAEWWWTPISYLAVFSPAVLVAVAAWRYRFGVARIASVVFAFAYLAAASTWPLVHTGVTLPTDEGFWLVWIPGLPALALSLFWRFAPFVYLVAAALLSQIVGTLARDPSVKTPFIAEVMFAFTYSALPCAACVMLVRVGRMLDETRQSALAVASATAAAQARRFERHRFDALTHDGVIATLLEASRSTNSAILADYARNTIDDLNYLHAGLPVSDTIGHDGLIARVRAVISEIDDRVPLRVEHDAHDVMEIPAEVATAMTAAVGEGLRNWKRHAGTADCEVVLALGDHGVQVEIIDNGIGFDPRAVPPHRLGLRASIIDRLSEVSGGRAEVISAPGQGCRVKLGWAP